MNLNPNLRQQGPGVELRGQPAELPADTEGPHGHDGHDLAITTWIERTFHRRRRQRRLGKLTPIEYETIHRTALFAA